MKIILYGILVLTTIVIGIHCIAYMDYLYPSVAIIILLVIICEVENRLCHLKREKNRLNRRRK